MEIFWNILHYFVYKVHHKAGYYVYKYTGMFKLYDLPTVKNRFKNKFGINNPQEYLMEWWGNPYYGGSTWYSYILLNLAFMPPSLILIFLYQKFFGLPDSPTPYIIVMLSWAAIITIISHIYLMRHDKWIKYIKLFNKQPHEWKLKWGWISVGILLMPLLITIIIIMLFA